MQATTETGICNVRKFGAELITPKTEKREQNSSIENTIYGCVSPHVSQYITPNCISEDQLTLKWKSRRHKYQ
jgi:hypothetical protein